MTRIQRNQEPVAWRTASGCFPLASNHRIWDWLRYVYNRISYDLMWTHARAKFCFACGSALRDTL